MAIFMPLFTIHARVNFVLRPRQTQLRGVTLWISATHPNSKDAQEKDDEEEKGRKNYFKIKIKFPHNAKTQLQRPSVSCVCGNAKGPFFFYLNERLVGWNNPDVPRSVRDNDDNNEIDIKMIAAWCLVFAAPSVIITAPTDSSFLGAWQDSRMKDYVPLLPVP